jgi:hypothetical protein
MKRILASGYWLLVKTVASVTASVQYPESSIQNRLGGTTSDDEKIHRETVERLERRL